MGTPTIGGQTTGAVAENSGIVITGDLDDVGWGTGNNDDTWSITGAASYGSATINPATGTWSYDLDDSHPVVDALDPNDTLTDTFTVRMLDADGGFDTQDITITITGAVCFAAGTRIDTAQGPRPVESLRADDRIRTLDGGLLPLRWIGRQDVDGTTLRANAKLRPIRIAAGALGPGMPQRDLLVSRQHRMLVSGPVAKQTFGSEEALVPAIKLVGLSGISLDRTLGAVTYFHLLLDAHHIVFAEGAPSESLLPHAQALALLPEDARNEVAAILAGQPGRDGTAAAYAPARLIAQGSRRLRQFRERVRRSDLPLIAVQTVPEAAS